MVRFKLASALCALAVCVSANAQTHEMNIPGGDLKTALDMYASQAGIQLLYNVDDIKGLSTKGVHGAVSNEQALSSILGNSGLQVKRDGANAIIIFRGILFDLPAEEIGKAIAALGAQAHLNIAVPPEAAGQLSNPVKGSFEAKEALRRLIAGTGLSLASDNGSTIVLKYRNEAMLSTVTVTAQKRSQSAQSVPISMTTLSGKTLDDFHVQNLSDVSRLTPSLLVAAFSQNNPTIAIRGVSNTFSQIGVNKPVAVVVDDVFIPRNSASSFELYDLDSISVLKGPQGTLFGRNVTGGAIVINTRVPSFDERIIETQTSVGDYGDKQFSGLFSIPLNQDAAFKFSTDLHHRDGYGRDRLTGKEQDDINSRNYRAQLRMRLNSDIDATLSADYGQDWNGGRTLSSDTLGNDGNNRTSELGVDQSFDRTIYGTSAKVNWSLGSAGEITSITAYRNSRSREAYSGVGANFAFLAGGSQSVVNDADEVGTFSQELRYASPKWEQGDFVTGLYYMNEHGTRQLGTQGLAAHTGALSTNTLGDQAVDTTSYALFADGTLHLPAAIDFTAGLRYTTDEKTASLNSINFLTPGSSFAVNGASSSWRQFTPRAVLSWSPRKNFMAYTSVTRGFTAGGYNTEASSAAVFSKPFAPETVTSYEAGFKSQWLDNKLRLNASVYDMKYKDKQELVFNSTNGILTIVNAGRATVKGGELELAYKPVKWMDLSLGYSRTEGVYNSFQVGAVNNTGHPLGNAPQDMYSAAVDINVPMGTAGFLVGAASYSWIDSYYTGATQDPHLLNPGYAMVNTSLGFESADHKYRLTGWIRNLTNSYYILTRSTQVVNAEYVGEPRTFGITLSAKF
ncbi:MAG TPA: TonB-dependent receptor [Herbaspirillum sp.]|jgi:iron complex outermembrane receptor protein